MYGDFSVSQLGDLAIQLLVNHWLTASAAALSAFLRPVSVVAFAFL